MRGTSSAEVESFTTTEALPPQAIMLLNNAAGIFSSRMWWDAVMSHAMPPGTQALFVAIWSTGRIVALVPMLRTGQRLSGLTTHYTGDFTPLFAPGLDRSAQTGAMAAFGSFCRTGGPVRLDAVPAEWDRLAELEAGVRMAGLRALRFNHFGNWSEDVAGLDWPAYLLRRPGALRETIRRRLRRAGKMDDARFELFTQPMHLDQALEAYESVYSRSWKSSEPFPDFNGALMRAMAVTGLLRLGVWSVGGRPVAVQFWVVKDGTAFVMKLAHDEAFKSSSPGTVLTALMVQHLLDQDHVIRIDLGRGDDPYKQGWAAQRRQRIGLLLVDPWQPSGLAALLRHAAGRVWAAIHP